MQTLQHVVPSSLFFLLLLLSLVMLLALSVILPLPTPAQLPLSKLPKHVGKQKRCYWPRPHDSVLPPQIRRHVLDSWVWGLSLLLQPFLSLALRPQSLRPPLCSPCRSGVRRRSVRAKSELPGWTRAR